MLSIANISSSGAASSYYELDDYYAKDSEEHKELSQWFGAGAKELGLKGTVDSGVFKALLDGILPNRIELGRINNGERHHAPGIDMTFSAPKSVSIMAEVGGDKRIYKAHQEAVKVALSWAEGNAVATRAMRNGKLGVEQTPNITAALFRHDTSRNMDPQLHTHCVLANAVKRSDKEWRSAYFGEIFDNKMLLGQIYRTELAKGMSRLGYNIDMTHKDGRFELREVPANIVSAFSSRSKEIRAALEKYEFVNAKTAANAAIRTRDSKVEMDRGFLKEKWVEISKDKGFHIKDVVEQIVDGTYKVEVNKTVRNVIEEKWQKFISLIGRPEDDGKVINHSNDHMFDKGTVAERSVRYAVNHLSERSSVFDVKEIYRPAMSYGIGKVRFEQIGKAIDKLSSEGFILKGQGGLYTTSEALSLEKQTIGFMKSGQGLFKAIMGSDKAESIFSTTKLNESQKEAAKHILSSTDRVVGIQGYAGVGKTFMLNATRQVAESQGYKMIGMAPSASAADTLEKDSGIKSQTIHQFLYKYKGLIEDRGTQSGRMTMSRELDKKVLVLDESSLASTKQVHGLLKVADRLGVRVVMIGDEKQLGAVEAGKPFAQLQENGMSVANMEDIFRQRSDDLKEAVLHSIEGNVYKALDKLGDNVIQADDLAEKAASLWLSHEDRENTLVLSPSNKTRAEINENVRDALKEGGIINTRSEDEFSRLSNKGLTKAEAQYISNYEKGDIVLFNRSYAKQGAVRGEYYSVVDVNKDNSAITLESVEGKSFKWNVAHNNPDAIDVYKQDKILLAEGDKVVWKRNDRNEGIINSHNAVVQKISSDKISFLMQSGKEKTFGRNDPAISHIDHAYAVTVYSAQGKTANNVIAVADSSEKFLTTQPTFYVEISRAKDEAVLLVDDKEKVADRLSEATGDRISAMESQGLVYGGESPFEKAEREAIELAERFENDKGLNEIAKPEDANLEKPDVEIKRESALDELDRMFSEYKYEPSKEQQDKVDNILANAKTDNISMEHIFPEMFDYKKEDKKESFEDFIDKNMPKVTDEDREAAQAKIEEIKAAKEQENENSDNKSTSEDKSWTFEWDKDL